MAPPTLPTPLPLLESRDVGSAGRRKPRQDQRSSREDSCDSCRAYRGGEGGEGEAEEVSSKPCTLNPTPGLQSLKEHLYALQDTPYSPHTTPFTLNPKL
jgi:hypothetical protein